MNYLFEFTSVYLSNPWGWWGLWMCLFVGMALLGLRYRVWQQVYRATHRAISPRKPSQGGAIGSLPFLRFFVSLILGSLFGFLLQGFLGLALGLGLGALAGWGLNWREKVRQQHQLSTQLPLFLRALASTLKAGYSVPQALEFVALEVQDPLQKTLSSGVQALRWQQPLEAVLAEWRSKINVPEFHFLTDSLLLQSRSGGNLVDLCHRVAYLLEERAKLERDIQSFTAQGKMSGYLMAGLWPMSLLLFAWLAPNHTEVLFHTTAGQILLSLSFLLAAIGFYFMWRLVRLKI